VVLHKFCVHGGQGCRTKRFLGSGLAVSLKMYRKFVGRAVRSVSGESGTEMRTIRRRNKKEDVSWTKYKWLVLN
jgi:hypothetical protein